MALGAVIDLGTTLFDDLALEHEVITIDLPDFGDMPTMDGQATMSKLADTCETLAADLSVKVSNEFFIQVIIANTTNELLLKDMGNLSLRSHSVETRTICSSDIF
ncbi:MAG TPA: hypothetical protein VF691_07720 [Cytophagaceae bacterium]|jgi:hypothetical protein